MYFVPSVHSVMLYMHMCWGMAAAHAADRHFLRGYCCGLNARNGWSYLLCLCQVSLLQ